MKRRNFIRTSLFSSSLVGFYPSLGLFNHPVQISEVINSGVGGNNTIDLLARIDKDCLAYKPDLTILMVGTNDMNSKKYVPLKEYETNMRKMIDMILQAGSKILLMNLLPVYEPYLMTRHNPGFYQPEGHTGRKLAMNNLIKNLALEYKLSFLDLHTIFEKVGNIGLEANSLIKNEMNSQTKDGLHPTPEGYRLIGVTVYEHIINQHLPTNKIVCFGDSITIGDGKPEGVNYPAYLKKLLNE